MLQATLSRDAVAEPADAESPALQAFWFMLLARTLDDKMASLYRAGGKIHGGVFLGRGQEALSAAIGVNLQPGIDVFAPLVRDTAGRLAFGEPVSDCVQTYFGSAKGPMRGRDGNVHRGRIDQGIIPMISHLGAMISVVNGILFAKRMLGHKGMVGVTCLGDGGTSTGAFHEALNQAAVERLPLVLVVANNQFAYSTPNQYQFACRSLADRAAGYGVTSHEADGTDLRDTLKVMAAAMAHARAGRGPQFVVASLLRLCGHGEHDDASYIGTELKASKVGSDCIKVAEDFLLGEGALTPESLAVLRSRAISEVEHAVAAAQREAAPDPYGETWQALSSAHLLDHGGTVAVADLRTS
jgi:pyruvate dehydrogenase E1 component alpha subunit/2-oxoisovalerate dehydrogenase E1 component alpha subunit